MPDKERGIETVCMCCQCSWDRHLQVAHAEIAFSPLNHLGLDVIFLAHVALAADSIYSARTAQLAGQATSLIF
jgi:hypothetical protein